MATEVAAAEQGADGEVGAERLVWYERRAWEVQEAEWAWRREQIARRVQEVAGAFS